MWLRISTLSVKRSKRNEQNEQTHLFDFHNAGLRHFQVRQQHFVFLLLSLAKLLPLRVSANRILDPAVARRPFKSPDQSETAMLPVTQATPGRQGAEPGPAPVTVAGEQEQLGPVSVLSRGWRLLTARFRPVPPGSEPAATRGSASNQSRL